MYLVKFLVSLQVVWAPWHIRSASRGTYLAYYWWLYCFDPHNHGQLLFISVLCCLLPPVLHYYFFYYQGHFQSFKYNSYANSSFTVMVGILWTTNPRIFFIPKTSLLAIFFIYNPKFDWRTLWENIYHIIYWGWVWCKSYF